MNEWIEEKIEELEDKMSSLYHEYGLHNMPVDAQAEADALENEIIMWEQCPKLTAQVYPDRFENSRYLYVYKPRVSSRSGGGCPDIQAAMQKILDNVSHYVPCEKSDYDQKMLRLLPKGRFFKLN